MNCLCSTCRLTVNRGDGRQTGSDRRAETSTCCGILWPFEPNDETSCSFSQRLGTCRATWSGGLSCCRRQARFSGSYTLKKTSGAARPGRDSVLRVTQSESAIAVTRELNGRQYVNNFRLDGSEGKYVSPGGATGTCKAQRKSKSLILDSFVTTHPQPDGPAVEMHTRERWELSKDSTTLKIHTDVNFPQFSGTLSGFQVVEPWTEIYTRN